jgi:hypothetical protein
VLQRLVQSGLGFAGNGARVERAGADRQGARR